ncbi:MAG: hypothetical protein NVS3B26_05060 [Mycobacteriales bacterium]
MSSSFTTIGGTRQWAPASYAAAMRRSFVSLPAVPRKDTPVGVAPPTKPAGTERLVVGRDPVEVGLGQLPAGQATLRHRPAEACHGRGLQVESGHVRADITGRGSGWTGGGVLGGHRGQDGTCAGYPDEPPAGCPPEGGRLLLLAR